MVLAQALGNPKSSRVLNEWIDEKLDGRFEAFESVNRHLRGMVDKLELENAELRSKIEGIRSQEEVNKHLKETIQHLRAQYEKLETKHDASEQRFLVADGPRVSLLSALSSNERVVGA